MQVICNEASLLAAQAAERDKWNKICKCVKNLQKDLLTLLDNMPQGEHRSELSRIMKEYFK